MLSYGTSCLSMAPIYRYVLIAETDHLFLREPKNRATQSTPVCFPFGYMNAKAPELRPTVKRYVNDPDAVDPCGENLPCAVL